MPVLYDSSTAMGAARPVSEPSCVMLRSTRSPHGGSSARSSGRLDFFNRTSTRQALSRLGSLLHQLHGPPQVLRARNTKQREPTQQISTLEGFRQPTTPRWFLHWSVLLMGAEDRPSTAAGWKAHKRSAAASASWCTSIHVLTTQGQGFHQIGRWSLGPTDDQEAQDICRWEQLGHGLRTAETSRAGVGIIKADSEEQPRQQQRSDRHVALDLSPRNKYLCNRGLLSHFSNIKHFRPRVFQHLSHYSVGGPISRDLPAAVFNLQRRIANMENTDVSQTSVECRRDDMTKKETPVTGSNSNQLEKVSSRTQKLRRRRSTFSELRAHFRLSSRQPRKFYRLAPAFQR